MVGFRYASKRSGGNIIGSSFNFIVVGIIGIIGAGFLLISLVFIPVVILFIGLFKIILG